MTYNFDGPYSGCYAFPEVATDQRHVFSIYRVLCAGRFAEALEIGSFNGASSTAFVEAINRELLGRATFCEVSPQQSLFDVVNACKFPERVRVTPQPSWAVLDSRLPFDFIFVDAAHDIDSVSLEVKRLLERRPRCIMAHDTNATDAGYRKCEGAKMLKETFQGTPGYFCAEDCEHRDGERTERGLFIATLDPQLLKAF